MSEGVRVTLDERKLTNLVESPDGSVAADLRRRCLNVQAAAQRGCPVDTGRLRSSIQQEVTQRDGNLVGVIGTDVEYAIFVHEGTRYMEGRPFLVDALPAAGG